MVTSIDDCYEIIERLRNERNALRQQLDAVQTQLRNSNDDNAAMRRQLDTARAERDRARQALQVRELEATGLYDCYGQPIK